MMKSKNISAALAFFACSLIGSQNAFASDVSQFITKDTTASEIIQYFFRLKEEGKPDVAVNVLKYAAENGNSAAQWKLARVYQTGDGVQKNPIQAFKIYKELADKSAYAAPNSESWQYAGHALLALGHYYKSGIPNSSIVPDKTKAKMMYTTSAHIYRLPDAQFELGRMQIGNHKNPFEVKLGIRNLGLAYQKGHPGSEAILGQMIFEGENMDRDPVRGLYMIGNAKCRARDNDLEWISQIHDEVFALAKPEERTSAVQRLQSSSDC